MHLSFITLVVFTEFAQLRFCTVFFETTEVVNENSAVKMIEFVLQAHGEKAGGLNFERFSVKILSADSDTVRTGDLFIKTLEGEATFFAFSKLVCVRLDAGIYQDEEVVFFVCDVNNNDTL